MSEQVYAAGAMHVAALIKTAVQQAAVQQASLTTQLNPPPPLSLQTVPAERRQLAYSWQPFVLTHSAPRTPPTLVQVGAPVGQSALEQQRWQLRAAPAAAQLRYPAQRKKRRKEERGEEMWTSWQARP